MKGLLSLGIIGILVIVFLKLKDLFFTFIIKSDTVKENQVNQNIANDEQKLKGDEEDYVKALDDYNKARGSSDGDPTDGTTH